MNYLLLNENNIFLTLNSVRKCTKSFEVISVTDLHKNHNELTFGSRTVGGIFLLHGCKQICLYNINY
jgi:hypothetical protein